MPSSRRCLLHNSKLNLCTSRNYLMQLLVYNFWPGRPKCAQGRPISQDVLVRIRKCGSIYPPIERLLGSHLAKVVVAGREKADQGSNLKGSRKETIDKRQALSRSSRGCSFPPFAKSHSSSFLSDTLLCPSLTLFRLIRPSTTSPHPLDVI